MDNQTKLYITLAQAQRQLGSILEKLKTVYLESMLYKD